MRAWYDGNVLAKAQFAIVGFLVIRDMDIVRYFANGKSFKLDDRIANARIFSREVEHSEDLRSAAFLHSKGIGRSVRTR